MCACSRFLRQLNGLLGRDSTGLHRYNIAWKGWSTAGTRHWFGRATLHRFILGFPAHDTIISTPFGEQRRFSLCRLLDRSLVPCCCCSCCSCCYYCCCCCCVLQAAELSYRFLWHNTTPRRHFFTIRLDARLFLYTYRWEKLGGGGRRNGENNDRFFTRTVIITQSVSESERHLKLDFISFLFLPPPTKGEYFNFNFLFQRWDVFLIKQRNYRVNNSRAGEGGQKT